MTVTFRTLPNRMQWLLNGVAKLDTALRTFMLVTGSTLTLTGVSIAYPNFTLDDAYYWSGSGAGGSGTVHEFASTYVTIPPQDWGPSFPNVLADILLGTVPTGTDFLDVQAVITRTVNPSNIGADPLTPLPKMGQRIYLRGGFCALEESFPVSRAFSVVLVGTNVYLRRRQSAGKVTQVNWSATNNPADNNALTWTTAQGNYVSLIQSFSTTSGTGAFTHQKGQSNQLSRSHSLNFASTYSADFIIKPGRFVTTPTVSAPTGLTAVRTWWDQQFAAASTFTFSSVPFYIADASRLVVVEIAGQASSTSTPTVSSVTIGGVAATKLVESAIFFEGASIWVANVPSGTSGNVVVNWSGTMSFTAILVYATYHLSSFAAHNTQVVTVGNGSSGATYNVNLTTVNPGFAFGVSVSSQGTQAMTGYKITGHVSPYDMSFQKTDGTNVAVSVTLGNFQGGVFAGASLG